MYSYLFKFSPSCDIGLDCATPDQNDSSPNLHFFHENDLCTLGASLDQIQFFKIRHLTKSKKITCDAKPKKIKMHTTSNQIIQQCQETIEIGT